MRRRDTYYMLITAILTVIDKWCHSFATNRIRNDVFSSQQYGLMNQHFSVPWTAIAEVDKSSNNDEGIHVIIDCSSSHVNKIEDRCLLKKKPDHGPSLGQTREVYDLSSPREWLEYNELHNGSAGAYTVIRCDLLQKSKSRDATMHKIWGKEFHLKRIKDSFQLFLNSTGEAKNGDYSITEESLSIALKISEKILDELIHQISDKCDVQQDDHDSSVKTLMLTLLWTPSRNFSNQDENLAMKINVQGHAYCNNIQMEPLAYNPNPISASVFVQKCFENEIRPIRYKNTPTAKISSWCRTRQSIETCYKADVGEVFLTRPMMTQIIGEQENEPSHTLLEGLTSNIFIVYKDGSIHTCHIDENENGGVLHGYGRHLILKAAKKCNIPIVVGPIEINNKERDLWSEVFITSSIKVIVPVNKILISDNLGSQGGIKVELKDFWSESSLNDLTWNTRRWKVLYNTIMKFTNQ